MANPWYKDVICLPASSPYQLANERIKKLMSSNGKDCWVYTVIFNGAANELLLFDDQVFFGALIDATSNVNNINLGGLLIELRALGRRLMRVASDAGVHRLVLLIVSVPDCHYHALGDILFQEKRTHGDFIIRLLPSSEFPELEVRVRHELSIIEDITVRKIFEEREIPMWPFLKDSLDPGIPQMVRKSIEADLDYVAASGEYEDIDCINCNALLNTLEEEGLGGT